jgi:DNA-binding CsgD family transcriptional regulator
MALVERDDELAVLDRLLADCMRSRGQVALISGSVASGKTELLHGFAERATQAGAVLLSATGSRAEKNLKFGVVRQLFNAPNLPEAMAQRAARLLSDEDIAATPDDFGVAAAVAAGPAVIGQASALVLDRICTALLESAKENPVVIEVDDVQFADGPSLQALLYLQRRMRFARVLVVLAEWALPRPFEEVFRIEVARQPNTTHIRLAPLSRAGVVQMLTEQLDAASANRLADVHHALSGGNPLLVNAIVEDHRHALRAGQNAARGADDLVVGHAFGQGVLACLYRWEPALLEVARGLAVLGDDSSAILLAKLLDVTADAAAQALDVLQMAGLLGAGRFRHPAARLAVLRSLTPQRRTALHLRAARLLHHDGASASSVAEHLTAAGEVDGAWAVGVLRRAAQEALAEDRIECAVRRLELAGKASTDDGERADITALLMRAEWRRNPSAAARYLSTLYAAFEQGRLDGRNATHLAESLLWFGHTAEVAQVLTVLTGSASTRDASVQLAQRWLGFLYPAALPSTSLSTVEHSAPAPAVADMLDRLRTGGSRDDLVACAEHVLQSWHLGEQPLGVHLAALTVLVHTDRVELAARWCDTLCVEAAGRQADTWRAWLGALRADIALRQGDLPAAADLARTAYERLAPQGWGVAIGLPLSLLVTVSTVSGDYKEAAGLLRQFVPEAMFQTQFGVQYLHARGRFYLATDRLHAAAGDFLHCGELMRAWDLDLPTLAPWRASAAEVQLRLGHREAARTLLAEQMTRPGGAGARTRGAALRLLAGATEPTRRTARLQEAVDLLQTSGDRLELARALADLSNAHNAAGDCERARTVARRALPLAKRCRAEPLIRQLVPGRVEAEEPERTDRDAEPTGMEALSEAERRVAVLAALGYTNREIGKKLYITMSTVEQHLTKVYRKLNVTRRTDLPAGLPPQALAAAEAL